eukprot:GFYU01005794.1.p1 GENE.GFYU01005794.1~~GFYU01005794.1.p1  ORF type:complete len:659 (+),score=155.32 GFYU01005794.1:146-2122(+)
MKFDQQFEYSVYEPWLPHYIKYKDIADKLYSSVDGSGSKKWHFSFESATRLTRGNSVDQIQNASVYHLLKEDIIDNFVEIMEIERFKVHQFFDQKREAYQLQYAEQSSNLRTLITFELHMHEVQDEMMTQLGELYRKVERLRQFAILNHQGLMVLLGTYMDAHRGKHSSAFYDLQQKLQGDSNLMSKVDDLKDLMEGIEELMKQLDPGMSKEEASVALTAISLPNQRFLYIEFGILFGWVMCSLLGVMYLFFSQDYANLTLAYKSNVPVYSFVIAVLVLLYVWAGVVYACYKARLNVPLLLEVDPRTTLSHLHWLKIALVMSLVSFHLMVMQLLASLYDIYFIDYPQLWCLTALLMVFLFLVWPFDMFYRKSRLRLMRDFCFTVLPLRPVKFSEFLVAEFLTSMAKPIEDLCFIVVYYGSGDWWEEDGKPSREVTNDLSPGLVVLPFVLRTVQCMRQAHDFPNRRKMHMLNAMKHVLVIVLISLASLQSAHTLGHPPKAITNPYYSLWLACYVCVVLFAFVWDVFVDWAVVIKNARGEWELKSTALCDAQWSMWLLVLTNLGMRVMWGFTLTPMKVRFVDKEYEATLLTCIELMRRGMWTVLRLQNEQENNPDNYRSITEISYATGYRLPAIPKKPYTKFFTWWSVTMIVVSIVVASV